MCIICEGHNIERITWLILDGCKNVKELPSLPISLERLDCYHTGISVLPPLPVTLEILYNPLFEFILLISFGI